MTVNAPGVTTELTVWLTPAEVLVAKLPSPAYVAVNVLAPEVSGTKVQPVAGNVMTQFAVPSLKLMVPVGAMPVTGR